MSKIMGVKVNMISKPGGGGTNCLPDYQQTPADGYTLLMHTDGLITKYVGVSMISIRQRTLRLLSL